MTEPVIDFQIKGETTHRRLSDLPDRVVEGDPQHETQMRFSSHDGSLMAGTWTSTPGRWHAFADRGRILRLSVRSCAADFRRWDRSGFSRR
jgi:uncharacterized cupin superfamily protein